MHARYSRRLLAGALVLLTAGAAGAAPIPRATLFSHGDRLPPMLAPDGHAIAYVANDASGTPQIFVRSLTGDGKDKAATFELNFGLNLIDWDTDSRTVLFHAAYEANGLWHAYALDTGTGNVRDLSPFRRVSGRIVALSRKVPHEAILGLNLHDRRVTDSYRCSIESGSLRIDTVNPGDAEAFVADKSLVVRAALTASRDGGTAIAVRDDERSMWRPLLLGKPDETVRSFEFTADGKSLALIAAPGTDTALAIERSTVTGKDKIVAGSNEADIEDLLQNPTTGAIEAAAVTVDRRRWIPVTDDVKADLEAIAKLGDVTFSVVSRDAADKHWILAVVSDRAPTRFFLWDRPAKKGTLLFTTSRELEGQPFVATRPIAFKARDGLGLHGYLTLPASGSKALPMVVLVHSGPWERDVWGFDSTVQWLANRGYAVLQVNYRGSSGFGQQFQQAGYREWGRKMQDDLADGVAWAVSSGVADAKRVAILGEGYGGYAALAGVALTPDLYAAAISESGPVNLEAMVSAVPADFAVLRELVKTRIGDPSKDRERLAQVSPVNLADRVKAAVLIGQAGKDERANPAETERFARALEQRKAKVTYVLYEQAQGGLRNPADRLDFLARMEAFLAKHLGGQAEPMPATRAAGSSATVKIQRE